MNKKKTLSTFLGYMERQRDYCNRQSKLREYTPEQYIKDGKYSDEQMSGYYIGRGEANWIAIYQIEDMLQFRKKVIKWLLIAISIISVIAVSIIAL